jgi:hypothetical protein
LYYAYQDHAYKDGKPRIDLFESLNDWSSNLYHFPSVLDFSHFSLLRFLFLPLPRRSIRVPGGEKERDGIYWHEFFSMADWPLRDSTNKLLETRVAQKHVAWHIPTHD